MLDSEAWELVARRVDPQEDAPAYRELFEDLDSVEGVAADLGMSSIELEELLHEGEVFGILEQDIWLVPRKQFVHKDGSFTREPSLGKFFKDLKAQVPYLSESPWVLWSLLFSGEWLLAAEDTQPTRDDEVSKLLDTAELQRHAAIANLREKLTEIDRRAVGLSDFVMELSQNVQIVPEDR